MVRPPRGGPCGCLPLVSWAVLGQSEKIRQTDIGIRFFEGAFVGIGIVNVFPDSCKPSLTNEHCSQQLPSPKSLTKMR